MNLSQPKLTDIFPVPCILKKLLRIQYAGVIIKSHIQTGHVKVSRIIMEDLKEAIKIATTKFFKGATALTGHIQAASHSLIPIVQDRDAAIEQCFAISIPAMI